MSSNMSLFIPRVFSNITSERIAMVFETQGFGLVKRVDLVSQGAYNRAYIHFAEWFDSPTVENFQNRILNKDSVHVVYDDPYYWIVLQNTSTSYNPASAWAPKQKINLEPVTVSDSKKASVEKLKTMLKQAPRMVTDPVMERERTNSYVRWLEMENYRLQQMVNYFMDQAEMDMQAFMEGEDEILEEQAELQMHSHVVEINE
jgi:hypothetical protein